MSSNVSLAIWLVILLRDTRVTETSSIEFLTGVLITCRVSQMVQDGLELWCLKLVKDTWPKALP